MSINLKHSNLQTIQELENNNSGKGIKPLYYEQLALNAMKPFNIKLIPSSFSLYISHPKLNCKTVAKWLSKQDILSNVSDNYSIAPNGEIEQGCEITVLNTYSISSLGITPGINRKRVEFNTIRLWNSLKKRFHLECAFFKNKYFEGCIYSLIALLSDEGWNRNEVYCPAALKLLNKQKRKSRKLSKKRKSSRRQK